MNEPFRMEPLMSTLDDVTKIMGSVQEMTDQDILADPAINNERSMFTHVVGRLELETHRTIILLYIQYRRLIDVITRNAFGQITDGLCEIVFGKIKGGMDTLIATRRDPEVVYPQNLINVLDGQFQTKMRELFPDTPTNESFSIHQGLEVAAGELLEG